MSIIFNSCHGKYFLMVLVFDMNVHKKGDIVNFMELNMEP